MSRAIIPLVRGAGLRRLFVLSLGALALGVPIACGTAASESKSSGSGSGAGSGSGGDANAGEGLPCDVQAVLAEKCWSCHGPTPSGGAPMSLTTYAELTAKSKTNPNETYAQLSIERMSSATSPMPPTGGATATDIAAFQNWVTAGTPEGDCDGGAGAGGDPFGGGVVCTSGKSWTQGTHAPDSQLRFMYPGQACIACHSKEFDAPKFKAAGTVYPTGHEPDACDGIDGSQQTDVLVHLEDSAGHAYDLPVNAAGNFYLQPYKAFVPPYSAKVVSSKGERAMAAQQTSGDCNSCHTQDGNGADSMAPGRIVEPW